MSVRWRVVLPLAVWSSIVATAFVIQHRSGSGTVDLAQRFIDATRGNWWAIVAFGAFATIRPVVVFPATLLTVMAGLLFGPVAGVAVAAIAANGSALLTYHLGRRIRFGTAGGRSIDRIDSWVRRLRANGFEAVLVMRLLFLPYDLVGYLCGAVAVPSRQFLLANAVGTLPGTVAFVLIGASIDRLDEGFGGIDGTTLAISAVMVLASVATSRVLRRRQTGSASPDAAVIPAIDGMEGR